MIIINSSPKNALKIFQPFLPIFIPIGPAILVNELAAQGITAHLLDQQVVKDVFSEVERLVRNLPKPWIFGFSVLTAAYRAAIETSMELKRRYPDSIILMGGIHPSAAPEEFLKYDHVDYVMRYESEYTLKEFYECAKAGGDPTSIPNLAWRGPDGAVVQSPRDTRRVDINALQPFPYHLFDRRHYDHGFVLSSRGCPYDCIFCSNRVTTGKKYRYNPTATVLAELEKLRDEGEKFLIFLDDNLLVSKKRIYELLDGIRERGLDKDMTFSFQARGDNVDYQLLKDMYDHGFTSVFFGLETASEEVMKTVKKGETVEQCLNAVRMAKDIGYHVSATFIFALPGETHQDRMDAIRLAKELKLDMVRFNNATPYPGTELFQIAKEQGRLHVQGLYDNFVSVGSFIENPFDKIPFSYVPPQATEREIRNDILFAYFSHYWDWSEMKSALFGEDQGVGWFDMGDGLWGMIKKIPALIFLFSMVGVKFLGMFWDVAWGRHTKIKPRELMDVLIGRFRRRSLENSARTLHLPDELRTRRRLD